MLGLEEGLGLGDVDTDVDRDVGRDDVLDSDIDTDGFDVLEAVDCDMNDFEASANVGLSVKD